MAFFYFVQIWNLVVAQIQPICTSKENHSAWKHSLKQQQNAIFSANFAFKGIKKYQDMIVMSIEHKGSRTI